MAAILKCVIFDCYDIFRDSNTCQVVTLKNAILPIDTRLCGICMEDNKCWDSKTWDSSSRTPCGMLNSVRLEITEFNVFATIRLRLSAEAYFP